MNHIDPDLLALRALGEEAGSAADLTHLASCAECRLELAHLSRAVVVGRTTLDSGELLDPAPRVWEAIQRDVAEADAEAAVETAAATAPLAPVTPIRRWIPALAAAAAAVILAAGIGTWWLSRPATPTVLASATLDAFPAWPDASASAVVEERPDGSRFVDVDLEGAVPEDGFRELWLITSAGDDIVSLGVLDGTTGSFAIPSGLDLGRFTLVDISQEHFDGDPTHSGDSIVRGELAPA